MISSRWRPILPNTGDFRVKFKKIFIVHAHHCHWMNGWKATIGINGFTMVFGLANHWNQWFCSGFWSGNHCYQWFFDGFVVRQPLDPMVFQWFPMVANHWSNDGMVTIHRYGLIGVLFWVPFSISQHTKGNRLNSWLGRWLELVNTISFWEKSGDAPSLYPSPSITKYFFPSPFITL